MHTTTRTLPMAPTPDCAGDARQALWPALFVGALVLALVATAGSSVVTAAARSNVGDGTSTRDQADAVATAVEKREQGVRNGNWSIGSTSQIGSLVAGRATEFWLDGPVESGGVTPTTVEWDLGAPDSVGVRTVATSVLGSSDAPAVTHVYEQTGTVTVTATLVFDLPSGSATPELVVAECAPPPAAPSSDDGPAWPQPLNCSPPSRPTCFIGETLVPAVFDPESGELREPVRCQVADVVLPPQRIEVVVERSFDVVSFRTTGTSDDPLGGAVGGTAGRGGGRPGGVAGSAPLIDFGTTTAASGARDAPAPGSVVAGGGAGAGGAPALEGGAALGAPTPTSSGRPDVAGSTDQAPASPLGAPVVPGLWQMEAPDPRTTRPKLVVGNRAIDLDDLESLGWIRGADDAVEPGPLELGVDSLIGETIIGDWFDDNVTLFGETRGAVVRLGAGQDRLVVLETSVLDTLFDLADGNDTLTLTNVVIDGTTITLGSGTDTLDLVGEVRSSSITQTDGTATVTLMGAFIDSTIDLGGSEDSLLVAGELSGGRLLLGSGNDSLALVATTRETTVELGDGEDELLLEGEVSGLVVDLGAGMDTVALGESFRGDVIVNDPARSTVKADGSNLRDNDKVILSGEGWIRRDGESPSPTFVRLVNDEVVAKVVLGSENVEVVATTTGEVLLERQPERKRRGFLGRLFSGLVKVFKFVAPLAAVLFPPAAVLIGVATGVLGLVQGVAAGCLLCAIGAAASFVPGVGAIVSKGVDLIQGALDNNFIRGIAGVFSPLVAKIGSAVENIVDSKPVAAIVDVASATGSIVKGAAGRTIDLLGQGVGKTAALFSGGAKAWFALTTWAIGAGSQLEAVDAERERAERLARLAEVDPLTRRLQEAKARQERSAIPAGETLFLDGSISDLVAPATQGLMAQSKIPALVRQPVSNSRGASAKTGQRQGPERTIGPADALPLAFVSPSAVELLRELTRARTRVVAVPLIQGFLGAAGVTWAVGSILYEQGEPLGLLERGSVPEFFDYAVERAQPADHEALRALESTVTELLVNGRPETAAAVLDEVLRAMGRTPEILGNESLTYGTVAVERIEQAQRGPNVGREILSNLGIEPSDAPLDLGNSTVDQGPVATSTVVRPALPEPSAATGPVTDPVTAALGNDDTYIWNSIVANLDSGRYVNSAEQYERATNFLRRVRHIVPDAQAAFDRLAVQRRQSLASESWRRNGGLDDSVIGAFRRSSRGVSPEVVEFLDANLPAPAATASTPGQGNSGEPENAQPPLRRTDDPQAEMPQAASGAGSGAPPPPPRPPTVAGPPGQDDDDAARQLELQLNLPATEPPVPPVPPGSSTPPDAGGFDIHPILGNVGTASTAWFIGAGASRWKVYNRGIPALETALDNTAEPLVNALSTDRYASNRQITYGGSRQSVEEVIALSRGSSIDPASDWEILQTLRRAPEWGEVLDDLRSTDAVSSTSQLADEPTGITGILPVIGMNILRTVSPLKVASFAAAAAVGTMAGFGVTEVSGKLSVVFDRARDLLDDSAASGARIDGWLASRPTRSINFDNGPIVVEDVRYPTAHPEFLPGAVRRTLTGNELAAEMYADGGASLGEFVHRARVAGFTDYAIEQALISSDNYEDILQSSGEIR
jgi:hypothetical protein